MKRTSVQRSVEDRIENVKSIKPGFRLLFTSFFIACVQMLTYFPAYAAGTEYVKYAPQTGDTANLWLWVVLIAIAVIGLIAALFFRKKNGKDDNDDTK